jgi:hypothetical protein
MIEKSGHPIDKRFIYLIFTKFSPSISYATFQTNSLADPCRKLLYQQEESKDDLCQSENVRVSTRKQQLYKYHLILDGLPHDLSKTRWKLFGAM